MDLNYPIETEPFRAEIRSWLSDNLPEGWGTPGFSMPKEERKAFLTEWTAKLFELRISLAKASCFVHLDSTVLFLVLSRE